MIKAVIFDMDSLMIDSERVTFECYQEIIKPMNLTMDETFYKTLLGNLSKESMKDFTILMVRTFLLMMSLKMYML